jgi:uncharacterized 2Fe-2S/4Fe-4S cluster protein (DUF4445 family)
MIESPCNALGTCGKCKVLLRYISQNDFIEVPACQTKVYGDCEVQVKNYAEENRSLKIINTVKTNPNGIFNTILDKAYAIDPFIKTEGPAYGVTVDIGTTTVVSSLADLHTGKELVLDSALNPQSQYAQDVLSRIHHGSKPEGLETLRRVLIDSLKEMIGGMAQKAGIDRGHIYEVLFSGNTTMLHIACGVDPAPLGHYPYTPVLQGGEHLRVFGNGESIGAALDIAPGSLVYLPPLISAYVGADITSGILAAGLGEKKGTTVFIDIGTNGEMVIARDGVLAASSSAAGPEIEGMYISCGMRASRGAIESFAINTNGEISFEVIGGGTPAGLCGSGLLDIAGELVRTGIIGPNGRFASGGERLGEKDGKRVFFINDEVYLAQKDVRQIQLAKGAIRCGIEMLLSRLGLASESVDSVVIAGSFGYHLNEASLLNIGLLPRAFAGKVEFAGNTSLSGGQAMLLNVSFRKQMIALTEKVDKVELADDPDFEKTFIGYLSF